MISGNALCNFSIKCLAHKTRSSLIHTNVMIISFFVLMCDVIPRDRKCSVVCDVRETPNGSERKDIEESSVVRSCRAWSTGDCDCWTVLTVIFLRTVTRPCARTVPSNCTALSFPSPLNQLSICETLLR